MGNRTIVVLGGYGQAGRAVVRHLLEYTDARVRICGRRLDKAEAVRLDLQQTGAGERVTACRADAADPESLREAFSGVDLVIVTLNTVSHAANIARACLDADCDYFDIHDPPDVVDTLNLFASRAEEAGRLFVTQGGLGPGMPAALVRLAASSFERFVGCRLGLALSLKTAERYEQVYDVFDFIVRTRPMAYKAGAWQEASFRDRRSIDFGARFGMRQAFPIDMVELHALPEQLGLEELSIHAGSPNWIVDYLTSRLIGVLDKIKPRLGWPTLARLVFWMAKKMPHEPPGFSTVLDAWGRKDGRDCTARWVIDHEDNYVATAVTVMAFLKQYEAGVFNGITGVSMMGHIIDPERCVRDLDSMGVPVRQEGEIHD
jgi:saccharopine dehydrogenase (NAD+, L-lysine-forming)